MWCDRLPSPPNPEARRDRTAPPDARRAPDHDPSGAQAARSAATGRTRVIEECVAIALQAPSGSNRQAWQFVPVDDPATQGRASPSCIARCSTPTGAQLRLRRGRHADGARTRSPRRRCTCATTSTRCPCCSSCTRKAASRSCRGGRTGVLGLGRPRHLELHARPAGSRPRLGLDDDDVPPRGGDRRAPRCTHDAYTQIGMFPVAYTIGTDFKPAPRLDPASVIHWNRWDG